MPIAHRMETNKTHTKMKIKNIEGYDGIYQVSECGKVYSKRFSKTIEMKQPITNHGYFQTGLTKNGVRKFWSVHRLVAMQFIQNPENKPCVNHIDGVKTNNLVENLEWCTYSENMQHAFDIGLKKQKKGSENKKSKSVIQFDFHNNIVKIWGSIIDIQRELGFKQGNIVQCCKLNVKYKTAYGFKWRYNV